MCIGQSFRRPQPTPAKKRLALPQPRSEKPIPECPNREEQFWPQGPGMPSAPAGKPPYERGRACTGLILDDSDFAILLAARTYIVLLIRPMYAVEYAPRTSLVVPERQ